ncbi:MAG: ThiF family adenylyltransferase [Candidatus Hydrogenedentes bacterium]|nr:ThiF family adenylyltransferase [Candidatus Hydrogenedentota bacterium]
MFSLSETPLDLGMLRAATRDVEAGGFAAFEGWVRNRNEGKEVRSLEYEAYPAVAIKEGNRILAEAKDRFGVIHAECTHRTGHLALEDIAVWVGVSAAHRGEAFEACRYIIDEVKLRVPIWKKEHYVDGDSGWVNCERCAARGHGHDHAHHPHGHGAAPVQPAAYYARQLKLPEVGPAGQDRLAHARVLVVGAGGLGAAALPALAAAGVGHIGICDGDRIEISNLHRQTIYTLHQAGQPKAAAAADYLRALNPFVQVQTHPEKLTPDNVEAMLVDYDIVLDCTDNFEAKFLLNDAAIAYGKILVQASIYQYEGQIFVVNPHREGPCLRCVWPEMPDPGCVGSCAEAGVLGAVPAVFGAMQSMEALKILLDLPRQPENTMIFFDLLTLRTRRVTVNRNHSGCVCQSGKKELAWESHTGLELSWEAVEAAQGALLVIDIREEAEREAAPLDCPNLAFPASVFPLQHPPMSVDQRTVLCCSRGFRSRYLAMALRKAGFPNVYSLSNGLQSLHPTHVAP